MVPPASTATIRPVRFRDSSPFRPESSNCSTRSATFHRSDSGSAQHDPSPARRPDGSSQGKQRYRAANLQVQEGLIGPTQEYLKLLATPRG
jgi:hypothetical protein